MKPSTTLGSRDLPALTGAEWRLLIILAGLNFTHIVDFMILMPLGPQLMRLFQIGANEFGLLVSSYSFAAGVSGFAGIFFLDRFDRKRALLCIYAGFIVGTFACALAPTSATLLAARAFTGAFGGLLGTTVMTIVSDAIPATKRGRAMGIVMSAFAVASVVGVPAALALANVYTWHAPFVLVGCLAILLSLAVARFVKSQRAHLDPQEDAPLHTADFLRDTATDPLRLTALGLTALLMLAQFTVIPFISPSLVANVGFREDQLPLMYLIGGGFTIFTSPWVGKLCDRYGRPPVFLIASILVLIPFYIVTHLGPTPLIPALSVAALFFVLNNARFVSAWAMITSTVRAQERGRFLSLNSAVQSLAGAVAAWLGSSIVQSAPDGRILHYGKVGWISIGFSIVAIFVARRLK